MISYSQLLLTLLILCALVATVSLVFLVQDVRQTMRELRVTLRRARRLAARTDGVVRDVRALTTEVSQLGAPALRLLRSVGGPLRHVLAFLAGLRVAVSTLARRRQEAGGPGDGVAEQRPPGTAGKAKATAGRRGRDR